jgi:hypothetical protein
MSYILHKPLPLRFLPRLVFLAALWLSALTAHAHTPFLLVTLTDDGNLRIETGFSDGSTGAGMPIELLDIETGALLATHIMPDDGILSVSPPAVPYEVVLDAGEGHRVSKDGPLPAAPAPQAALFLANAEAGDLSRWSAAARAAIESAQVIVVHEYLAQRLSDNWNDKTLVLVEDGVLLGAESSAAAALREKTLARIRAALDAGQSVAVLAHDAPESSPDWAWLLEAEPRAVAAGTAAP